MVTPFRQNYGYGLRMGTHLSRRVVGHGGAIHGFRTQIDWYPQEKVCVIVLSNLGFVDPAPIAKNLAAITFGEDFDRPEKPRWIDLDAAICAKYAGRYQLALGILLTVKSEGNGLLVQVTGGNTARFYPESEIDFRRQFAVDRLTFSKAGRRVTHLTLEQDGVEAQADRIQAEPESIREDCYAEGVFYQPERP